MHLNWAYCSAPGADIIGKKLISLSFLFFGDRLLSSYLTWWLYGCVWKIHFFMVVMHEKLYISFFISVTRFQSFKLYLFINPSKSHYLNSNWLRHQLNFFYLKNIFQLTSYAHTHCCQTHMLTLLFYCFYVSI